jgi:hypothetical protein
MVVDGLWRLSSHGSIPIYLRQTRVKRKQVYATSRSLRRLVEVTKMYPLSNNGRVRILKHLSRSRNGMAPLTVRTMALVENTDTPDGEADPEMDLSVLVEPCNPNRYLQ